MKFNEPVRPAGIGRKQVAFDVNRNPSAFTIVEDVENTQTDPGSVQAQNTAAFVQATAMSRAIAYSAASSAMSNNQNEIWGVRGMADFTVTKVAFTNLGYGYVKWDFTGSKYVYTWPQINNPFMWIDSEDSSKIRVNRPGWYLVDALVAVDNYKNSQNYKLDIIVGGSEIVVIGFDSLHTNQYPTLRVNAIVPVPAYTTDPAVATTTDPYFQVRLGCMDGLNNDVAIQGDGFIHAIWIKPYEADEAHSTN